MVARVDWITQAALGAALGELMMGKRLGNRALAWGALFGILPELFLVIFPLIDTAREVAWDHAAGHSLAIIGLGSWGLGHGLGKIWKREKISQAEAGWFVFAVWAAHVLADCFTTEGAALLWPFIGKRMTLNILYPVDLLFTAPLLVTTIWLALVPDQKMKKPRGKKTVPLSKRRKLCYWGLGLSAAYVLLATGAKFKASSGFDADLARRGTKSIRRMEAPTPYNILLWRAVVDRGDEFWVGYRSVFEFQETPVRWTVYPKSAESLAPVAEMREAKTLAEVSDGWWIARPHAKGAWLGDIRLPESRVWGSKKTMVDSRLQRSWVIDSKSEMDHLRPISANPGVDPEYLKRMITRIGGNREKWEENPRLAGVSGSLPEFLPAEQ